MKPLLSPLVALVCAVLAFAGCATHINPSLATNPPPAEAFSGFTKIQLGSVRFDRKCERTSDGERALAKIQEKVKPVVAKFAPQIREEFIKGFYAEIEKARATN